MSGEASKFVQFIAFNADRMWRRLPVEERESDKAGFIEALNSDGLRNYCYSLVGLKAGVELLIWRFADDVAALQENTARLLRSGLGRYLEPRYLFLGLTRPSIYTGRHTQQEQAMFVAERKKFLVVYPFTKTKEWYLLSRDARQGMMNEHIRVGREYSEVRQLLAYSFGIDDQEFVVAYETDDLKTFQDLVMALRETEARRYTKRDTPIITGIHRQAREVLDLLG